MKKRLIYSSLIISIVAVLAVSTPSRLRYLTLDTLSSLKEPFFDYHLGDCYFKGRGVDRDLKQAEFHYLEAAKRNHAKAMYKLGNLYSHRHGMQRGVEIEDEFWESIPLDYEKALTWYTLGGNRGSRSAACRVAYFNAMGYSVPVNYKKAFLIYQSLAYEGVAPAQCWLGYFYSHGAGWDRNVHHEPGTWDWIEKNYTKAIKWYKKSAKQGFCIAQIRLGYLYVHGGDLFEDNIICDDDESLKKAFKWFRKAAIQGNELAQSWLGYLYGMGKGTPQDYSQAFKWYMKAALRGYFLAQRWVGSMYEFGIGVSQNEDKAIEWHTKAAAQGDLIAFRYANSLRLTKGLPPLSKSYLQANLREIFPR